MRNTKIQKAIKLEPITFPRLWKIVFKIIIWWVKNIHKNLNIQSQYINIYYIYNIFIFSKVSNCKWKSIFHQKVYKSTCQHRRRFHTNKKKQRTRKTKSNKKTTANVFKYIYSSVCLCECRVFLFLSFCERGKHPRSLTKSSSSPPLQNSQRTTNDDVLNSGNKNPVKRVSQLVGS